MDMLSQILSYTRMNDKYQKDLPIPCREKLSCNSKHCRKAITAVKGIWHKADKKVVHGKTQCLTSQVILSTFTGDGITPTHTKQK